MLIMYTKRSLFVCLFLPVWAFMKKHHVAQNCPGCFHLPERFMCDCLLGHTYNRKQWWIVYFSSFELPLGPLLCSYTHGCVGWQQCNALEMHIWPGSRGRGATWVLKRTAIATYSSKIVPSLSSLRGAVPLHEGRHCAVGVYHGV